jgi:flavodoxin I
MKVLVVYESFFTNTEKIARAIGEAFGREEGVEVLRADDVTPEQLAGVDLLIVGSPTRAFRPTPATVAFIKRIPKNGLKGIRVAAFDTRIGMDDIGSRPLRFAVRLFGYAAKPISNRLSGKGGEVVVPPEGFYVTGTEGPLKEGEVERAAEWARRIPVKR